MVLVLTPARTHHQDPVDHPLHGAQPLLPQVGAVGTPQRQQPTLPVTFQVGPLLHDLTDLQEEEEEPLAGSELLGATGSYWEQDLSVVLSQTVDLIRDLRPLLLLGVHRHAAVELLWKEKHVKSVRVPA